MTTLTVDQLLLENEELRHRLEEAEEALRAIRRGEIDAVVVQADQEQVYTLETPETTYRLLVARVPQAAVTLTEDGAIIACNRRFADLLQRSPSALSGRLLREFVAPDSQSALARLLQEGSRAEVQDTVTLLCSDGAPCSAYLGVSPLGEGALAPCLMVTDLTQQRYYEEMERAQEALRESQERLASELAATRGLQEISTRLIQEGDADQLYGHILDAAVAIMRSDFATMQLFDRATDTLQLLAHRGFDAEFAESFRRLNVDAATTCGFAWQLGRRVVAPDFLTFEGIAGTSDCDAHLAVGVRAAQSTPLVSRTGEMLGMISTHWRTPYNPPERDLNLLDVLARQAADLIERSRAEQALVASEARLRAILDNMPAVVYVVDDQERFSFINRHWKSVFNLTNEQTAGRPLSDFFPAEIAEQLAAVNRKVLETREPIECEEVVPQADGPHTYISSKFPFLDPAGAAYAVCGVSIDITERKRAEQALRDADRSKDEFLATVAHELRNPLAPIRNAVRILQAKGPPTPELQWARDIIERQVEHMARLLEDLLDLSRVSQRKLELRSERIELAAVLDAAVETSRPLIQEAGHKLTVNLPTAAIPVNGDRVRLAQVFSNLLNNAAKYTEPGGDLQLTAQRQGSDVVVSVKDNGIGIPADVLPRVFEIFSQARPAMRKSPGGLGIGLSLVKGVVELHGGGIEARSEGPGRGSEFIVRLPVDTEIAPEESPPARDDAQTPACERRVLIVDDNRDSADSLKMLLELMGHEVRTAYDGEQAIEAARLLRPDVVLLDIGMPKLDGFEACRRIRQQTWGRDMYMIALTGWAQEEDRRLALEAGFDHHLVKPVNPHEILKLLASSAANGSRR